MPLPSDFVFTGPCVVAPNGVKYPFEGSNPISIGKGPDVRIPIVKARAPASTQVLIKLNSGMLEFTALSRSVVVNCECLAANSVKIMDTPMATVIVWDHEFIVLTQAPGTDTPPQSSEASLSPELFTPPRPKRAGSPHPGGAKRVTVNAIPQVREIPARGPPEPEEAAPPKTDEEMAQEGCWARLTMYTRIDNKETVATTHLKEDEVVIGRGSDVFDLAGVIPAGASINGRTSALNTPIYSRDTVHLFPSRDALKTSIAVTGVNGVLIDGAVVKANSPPVDIGANAVVKFLYQPVAGARINEYSMRVARIHAPAVEEDAHTLAVGDDGNTLAVTDEGNTLAVRDAD